MFVTRLNTNVFQALHIFDFSMARSDLSLLNCPPYFQEFTLLLLPPIQVPPPLSVSVSLVLARYNNKLKSTTTCCLLKLQADISNILKQLVGKCQVML